MYDILVGVLKESSFGARNAAISALADYGNKDAIPLIEHADTVAVVSNAPHAEMGREILWNERPDIAVRLVQGAEHRLGEAPVLKILGALRATYAKRTALWRRSSRSITPDLRPPRP